MFDFPVIDMVRTGQNIRNLRIAAGLSVRDVQEAFGFATPQAIYKWQRGMAMPTIDNMLVTIDELLVVDGMPEMHIGRGA